MSFLHAWSERFDEAASEARRAVELALGSADVAHFASFVLTMCDHGEEAVTLAEKAIALSPNYPAAYIGVLGDAYRHAHRIDEAIPPSRNTARAARASASSTSSLSISRTEGQSRRGGRRRRS